jgi:hypothetical protein
MANNPRTAFLAFAGLGIMGSALAGFQSAVPEARRPPVVDDTSSIGPGTPGKDAQAQSLASVSAGIPSSSLFPPCLRISDEPNAGSECVIVCVTVPGDSAIKKVEGFLQDTEGPPGFKPCNGKECGGSNSKSRFEPSGWTKKSTPRGDQVCWGFRNWDTDHGKNAILRVTYRVPDSYVAPSLDQLKFQ